MPISLRKGPVALGRKNISGHACMRLSNMLQPSNPVSSKDKLNLAGGIKNPNDEKTIKSPKHLVLKRRTFFAPQDQQRSHTVEALVKKMVAENVRPQFVEAKATAMYNI